MSQQNKPVGRGRSRGWIAALVASAWIALPLGCGDDGGLGRRYKVTGTVTYKGEKVTKGVVNFVPVDPTQRGAGGTIEDGQYTLTTLDPGDGALPGKYKVTVDTRQADMDKAKAAAQKIAKKKGMPGELTQIPQEFMAQALKEAKGTVPGKYQIAGTSDIEVEVKTQSNTIPIELKD